MKISAASEARIEQVSQSINAHLPGEYRRQIRQEERRVYNYFQERGIDGRLILIVGGAGYIGSVLIGNLLERGYRVRCTDLLLYKNKRSIENFLSDPKFEFQASDHVDKSEMQRALKDVTDVIFLAGLVGDPITKKYPKESEVINRDGYDNLADMLHGYGLNKVIFISTCSNYGLMPESQLANELSELNPLSDYARAKVAIEKKFLSLARTVDFAPIILRFATAFGLSPRMRFDLTISQFTREIALGEDLIVYDPDTWRPYCHVEDFSEVIRRVIEAPIGLVAGQVFNVGGDENNYTKRMIVDAVLQELGRGNVAYQELGSDPRNYRVNFEKIRRALHFRPSYTVVDGIRELLQALDQGRFYEIDNPPSFYGNYEIFYKIPTRNMI